jgi:hypothetical protein
MSHQVWLFTFKEGILSRVAHDLRLHVERFTVTREGDEIIARFEAASIVVDGVMHADRLDPNGLGQRDRDKITQTIRDDILRTRQHPSIEFRGRLDLPGLRCVGELTLLGVRRPLTIHAKRERDHVCASVSLRPSEFGISPYKALAGAIRLQDRVRVDLDLDAQLLGL